jgi:hypothetical protein
MNASIDIPIALAVEPAFVLAELLAHPFAFPSGIACCSRP